MMQGNARPPVRPGAGPASPHTTSSLRSPKNRATHQQHFDVPKMEVTCENHGAASRLAARIGQCVQQIDLRNAEHTPASGYDHSQPLQIRLKHSQSMHTMLTLNEPSSHALGPSGRRLLIAPAVGQHPELNLPTAHTHVTSTQLQPCLQLTRAGR
jgi:hypothetical protein